MTHFLCRERRQVMKRRVLSKRNECGRVSLKAIITLAILGALVYAAFQLVPIYWDHYNLRESVKEKVTFAFIHHPIYTQETVENQVYDLLDSIGAQYEEEDVRVEVDKLNKEIYVEIWYSRPHDLPFYQNPKEFHIELEGP
jgi:hypothetical protein